MYPVQVMQRKSIDVIDAGSPFSRDSIIPVHELLGLILGLRVTTDIISFLDVLLLRFPPRKRKTMKPTHHEFCDADGPCPTTGKKECGTIVNYKVFTNGKVEPCTVICWGCHKPHQITVSPDKQGK